MLVDDFQTNLHNLARCTIKDECTSSSAVFGNERNTVAMIYDYILEKYSLKGIEKQISSNKSCRCSVDFIYFTESVLLNV